MECKQPSQLKIFAYPQKLWISLCITGLLHAARASTQAFALTWSKNRHMKNHFKFNNLPVKHR